MIKMVNGTGVVCSPEEEAAILAEWAANDPATKPMPQPARDPLAEIDAFRKVLKTKGVADITDADIDAAKAEPATIEGAI